MSEELITETFRYITENGPYGDDYASNFMFNVSFVGSFLTNSISDILESSYGEIEVDFDDKLEEIDSERKYSDFFDSSTENIDDGFMYGTYMGLVLEGLSHATGETELFGNKSTMASVAGGTCGALAEGVAKNGLNQAYETLEGKGEIK